LQRQLEELVERHQQLMEEKELVNERDQQNFLVESKKRLVQDLTDEYEYKLLVLKEQLAQEHLTLQCIQDEKDKLMCELEETRQRVRPVQTLASFDKSLQVDNDTTGNKRRIAELLKKRKEFEDEIERGVEIRDLSSNEDKVREEQSDMRSGPRLVGSKGESEVAHTAATSALHPKDAQVDQLKRRLDLSREIYSVCAHGKASITAKTSSNTSGD
jgi:hypothetical protein